MPKGKKATIGSEKVNQNGYTMVKTSTGWRLKHQLEAEAKLGRPLERGERVTFINGDRTDFDHDNLAINMKQINVSQTYDRRLQTIEDKAMLFVEEAPDKADACDALLDIVNEARLAAGFGVISK